MNTKLDILSKNTIDMVFKMRHIYQQKQDPQPIPGNEVLVMSIINNEYNRLLYDNHSIDFLVI